MNISKFVSGDYVMFSDQLIRKSDAALLEAKDGETYRDRKA
jgi:hypothetical protein